MISFGLALPESTNGQCVLVRLFVSRATFSLGFLCERIPENSYVFEKN